MNVPIYPAHIRENPDGTRAVQTAAEHCRQAAAYASAALRPVGLYHAAFLSALLHDLGKFRDSFRHHLESAVNGAPGGSVIHSFQACVLLLRRFHKGDEPWPYYASELLAYAAAAHHGQFDLVDEDRRSGFQHRLSAAGLEQRQAEAAFFAQCTDEAELNRLFSAACEELRLKLERILPLPAAQDEGERCREFDFYLGQLARLLLSAVIEGDRRDTAEFMLDSSFPRWDGDMVPVWTEALRRVENRLGTLRQDTPVNRARGTISDLCRQAAEHPGGIYRLNVPTGGGKTLSSLRFALAHAARWNKRRIIFTSPLLSILDQNAQVIRDYIQDDSLILEHHSNVVRTREQGDGMDPRELLTQSWDAPIIITTLVQLLNTLFEGKTTCIRRFQALCDAVLVIDEVQTVPVHMLSLFNLAMTFLSQVCGTTVILCSATQPRLEAAHHPIPTRLISDLVTLDAKLLDVFRRTELVNAGAMPFDALPAFVSETMETCQSLLVVCNTKPQAAKLYQALEHTRAAVFHLSAGMCMRHRKDVLAKVNEALRAGERVLCISTQVIEAGVDLSFDCAIRLLAGLDSAVQTAGRCNRHGEGDLRRVYLVHCADERLYHLKTIQAAQNASLDLLSRFANAPERFEGRLDGDTAIQTWYQTLYGGMETGAQDFPVAGHETLFQLLSTNHDPEGAELEHYCRQAFRTAGSLFQVFDDSQTTVLVPYGAGAELIEQLCSQRALTDLLWRRELLEQAKPYTVSLFPNAALTKQLYTVCDGTVQVLPDYLYHQQTGFSDRNGEFGYQEV